MRLKSVAELFIQLTAKKAAIDNANRPEPDDLAESTAMTHSGGNGSAGAAT